MFGEQQEGKQTEIEIMNISIQGKPTMLFISKYLVAFILLAHYHDRYDGISLVGISMTYKNCVWVKKYLHDFFLTSWFAILKKILVNDEKNIAITKVIIAGIEPFA